MTQTNGHPFPLKPPVEMPPRPEPTRHLVIEVRDGDVVLGTEEPTVEDVAAWSQKPAPRACVKHATRGRPDMSCLACNVLSEPPRGDVELVFGFACVPNAQLLAECAHEYVGEAAGAGRGDDLDRPRRPVVGARDGQGGRRDGGRENEHCEFHDCPWVTELT